MIVEGLTSYLYFRGRGEGLGDHGERTSCFNICAKSILIHTATVEKDRVQGKKFIVH